MKNSIINSHFLLNPSITYLNFGSFGACPKPIFDEYQRLQLELEYEPVQFLAITGPERLHKSRESLSRYLGCEADELVFTTNPSYAINTIAKNFYLNPSDEVLTTNLEYGAMDYTWEYYTQKAGAKYVRQNISLPLTTKDKFIEEFFNGLTTKTKVIFLSQITSSTALIFPVSEICKLAREKGIFCIVDGAHVPGHISLNIKDLDCDVYTGACHKWMMAPKGCSFLYVKKEHQDKFDPLLISWGFKAFFPSSSKFIDYHQMQGTRDFSAFLTIPKCIEYMNEFDWKNVSTECRKLSQLNYFTFCDAVKSSPLCPINDEFLGQMCSVRLKTLEPEKFQLNLFEKHKIEIPVMRHGKDVYIRYSINAFNRQKDLDHLFYALNEMV